MNLLMKDQKLQNTLRRLRLNACPSVGHPQISEEQRQTMTMTKRKIRLTTIAIKIKCKVAILTYFMYCRYTYTLYHYVRLCVFFAGVKYITPLLSNSGLTPFHHS